MAMHASRNDPPKSASARRARILEHIQQVGGASLAELARDHAVSAITVHRDLDQLSREGLVERFHGGARAVGSAATAVDTAWTSRLREAGGAKDAIAAYARDLIDDGLTVFLDASSTCLALAHRLDVQPPAALTIVTNSPAIALGLEGAGMRVLVTPGEVDLRERAIADRFTVEFLARVNVDIAFVSAAGIDLEHGLTATRRPLADTLLAARAAAGRTVALLDAAKFGRASLIPVVPAHELDLVVSDAGLGADDAAAFRAAGVSLDVAPHLQEPEDDEA
jgi:DeoR family fructose operon transcriptional repressor